MRDASTRVLQYGLGPIGRAAARHVALHPDTELVDAPNVTVSVRDDAAETLADSDPDVVLHTTTSHLPEVTDQIARSVRADAHVVSSTEELLFPYERHPELTDQLDDLARRFSVVVVGTGVNPGFVMDTLALTATGVCTEVEHVRPRRVVGYVDGTERLDLRLQMYLGAENPRDAIRVDGTPPVDLEIDGGIFGDTATVGALTNVIPTLGHVRPGLRTIDELPVPRAALRAVRTESVRPGE